MKGSKATKQEDLIALLNPVIWGWANYHQHAVAKKAFASMDHAIWESLWQWAIRRYPKKGLKWIREKYFPSIDGRQWVFACKNVERAKWVSLIKTSDTRINRHVKIKGEANPFDPVWESYFEKRLGRQMGRTEKGKKTLLNHWRKQNGLCPMRTSDHAGNRWVPASSRLSGKRGG